MLGTSVLDNMQRDVYVATSSFNNELGGQIITWVTHASLVPEKRNVICVFSRFNHTYKLLNKSGLFSLNLPTESQIDRVSLFGLKSGNQENKFNENIDFEMIKHIPILKDTCGYSILKVLKEVDLGDRIIVISRVEHEYFDNSKKPLKLAPFLKGLKPHEIEMQKKNYVHMLQRDAGLIKDEI